MDAPVRIGTSGIVVPGRKFEFPEEYKSRSRLHYYASLFNTLEINSSFYKVPLPGTFARWEAEVPQDFKFTVKLWREITHVDRLEFKNEHIDVFMRSINAIQKKRGCLLIQFPASIDFTYRKKVEEIIQKLRLLGGADGWKLAVELRHRSWYQHETYLLLKEYGVALVFHDMPKSLTPFDYLDSELVYYRFHGPKGDYKGTYTREVIQRYASHIADWRAAGKEVYVYFNNTLDGAFENARLLQTLL